MADASRLPVTVIGGYLGAGKTTYINRLLADAGGQRLAVLVNDFGSTNVDADLIATHDGETISLTNGCVCCSIGDSLGDALDGVLALAPPVDEIVIEASGVADPAKVAHYGRGWPGCRLEAVVVLADVETIRERADDRFVGETVRRQLAGADVIGLTKTDLVSEVHTEAISDWLSSVVAIDAAPLPVAAHTFDTTTLDLDGIEQAALEAKLAGWPPEVVRVKGFVAIATEAGPVVHEVQRVGSRWSVTPIEERRRPPATGLVLIVIRSAGSVPPHLAPAG